MKFSEEPLIVRLISVALTLGFAVGVWHLLYKVLEASPFWVTAAFSGTMAVAVTVGLIWDYRKNGSIYRARRDNKRAFERARRAIYRARRASKRSINRARRDNKRAGAQDR